MISVVMATYNRAATVMRAINSVLSQSLQDWELIIVDDGSTDETLQILASIDDARVRVFRHPKNQGVTAAKNTGLDHVRGEWFTTFDSDDEMTVDALATMLECVERTGATAITCDCMDSATGEISGSGPNEDGWMSAAETAKCRGDQWGITRTALLGNLRFDGRVPGYESMVWLKIDQIARRYYIHRALLVRHTEGTDRVTVNLRANAFRRKVRIFSAIGEDQTYLKALNDADPQTYRQMIWRVRVARLLQPLLRRH